MSPSAVDTVQQTVDEIKEKVIPVQNKEQVPEVVEDKGVQVQEEELPELYTNHKEPLKLSGALEVFDSFDVTPVIGREYSNVDLVKLLRAPNSDELLRDLAITSEYRIHETPMRNMLLTQISLSTWRCLLSETGGLD